MNVRRLAAIDMYGTRGTMRRRRITLAEFVFGVVVMLAVGIWVLTHSSDLGGRALGVWFIGSGLNYGALAVYALMLCGPGVLDAELAGADTGLELRRYGVRQLWILVPLSLVVLAGVDALSRRARH